MVSRVIIKKNFIESLHRLDVFESQLPMPQWPILRKEANDCDHVCEQARIYGAVVQEKLKYRRLVLQTRSKLRLRPTLGLFLSLQLTKHA